MYEIEQRVIIKTITLIVPSQLIVHILHSSL